MDPGDIHAVLESGPPHSHTGARQPETQGHGTSHVLLSARDGLPSLKSVVKSGAPTASSNRDAAGGHSGDGGAGKHGSDRQHATRPEDTETQKLPDKVSVIVPQMLGELQEKTDTSYNEIRKTTRGRRKKFNKDIKNIKKDQTEISELQNTMTEAKNLMRNFQIIWTKQKKTSVSPETGRLTQQCRPSERKAGQTLPD